MIDETPNVNQLLQEPSFLAEATCRRIIELFQREKERDNSRSYARHGDRRTEIPLSALIRTFGSDASLLVDARSMIQERCRQLWQSLHATASAVPDLRINFSLVSCSRSGDMHSRHADNASRDAKTSQWGPNHTPYRVLTALTYLNSCDNDFEGGELYFPRINLAIKPRAGLLVASPSDEHWEHQTLPVIRGERYVLAIWFTSDRAWEEQLT